MKQQVPEDRVGRVLESVEGLLSDSPYEVVDVTLAGSSRGTLVRVLVDTDEGISIDECARLSRALGDHFEATALMTGAYVLEVSSPGVDRPLRREQDFQRFAGETVQVTTYEKIDERHKHVGTLQGFNEDSQSVQLVLEGGESMAIPLGAIRKARLKRDPWIRRSSRREAGDSPERSR